MNTNNIVLKRRICISDKEYLSSEFNPPQNRVLDDFTKRMLFTALRLIEDDCSNDINEDTGIVICTQTGPYTSLTNIADIIRSYSYKNINPSLFPNVMLSTALSNLTSYLNIHGPSCAFYDTDIYGRDGFDYCIVQINMLRANTMILICSNVDGFSVGRILERK